MSDSGYVKAVVGKYQSGLIAEPIVENIADAFNLLLEDSELYQKIVDQTANVLPENKWSEIIERFLED